MSPDERALLVAIAAAPDDDVPRLVYADWLDDHGDPRQAEFIRLSIQFALTPPDTPEADTLDDRLRQLVLPLLTTLQVRTGDEIDPFEPVSFPRGFSPRLHVSEVDPTVVAFREHLMTHPVTELEIGLMPHGSIGSVREPADPSDIPDWPGLSRFRSLAFCDQCEQKPEDVNRLLASPHLTGLRRLTLNSWPWRDEGDHTGLLIDNPCLANVTSLTVQARWFGDDQLDRLIDSGLPADLTELDIARTVVTGRGVARLAAHPVACRLQTVGLPGTPETADAFAAGRFGRADTVRVNTHPGARTVADVVLALPTTVKRLDLCSSHLSAGEAIRLLSAPVVPGLTTLTIREAPLGDDWLRAVSRLPALALRELSVRECGLRAGDAARLARLPQFARLRKLELTGNPIGNRGATALAASKTLTQLRRLRLQRTSIGLEGGRALSRSPVGQWVPWWDVSGNPLYDQVVKDIDHRYRTLSEWPSFT